MVHLGQAPGLFVLDDDGGRSARVFLRVSTGTTCDNHAAPEHEPGVRDENALGACHGITSWPVARLS